MIFLCSIVVTRALFNFTDPPVESKIFEVDSLSSCYALAADKHTASKFLFSVKPGDEYHKFCGPEGKGCPRWPS